MVDNAIRTLLNRKKAAWNNLRSVSTPAAWRHYRFKRNTYNRALRRCKIEHAKSIADSIDEAKFNPRQFWRLANTQLCRDKCDQQPSLVINDRATTDSAKISDEFNRVFSSKCTVDEPGRIPPFSGYSQHKIANVQFKSSTVFNLLKDLDPSTATGPDDIPALVLKNCAASLAAPLAALFHRSFRAGVVPLSWKRANVTAIHKKGSKCDAKNYRPISLMPIVAKIMEKIINDKLMRYLETNKMLHPSQFGFRKKHSTLQALLTITQPAEDALDSNQEYRVVSLDISSAFDKVWHAGLISKLNSYGVSGCLLKWLQNYLSNRQQRVVFRGSQSSWLPIMAGMPQGSVLGPTLFLLYINDLPFKLRNQCCLFADDTSIQAPVTSPQQHQAIADSINSDLATIDEWASIWQVKFNHSKSQAITISRRRTKHRPPPLKFGDSIINESNEIKLLGVTLNSALDWSPHVLDVARRSSQQYGAVNRAANYLPARARQIIYKTVIRPTIEYCSPCWGNASATSLAALNSIQRKCSRIMPNYEMDSLQHRRTVADLSVYHGFLERQERGLPIIRMPEALDRNCNTRQSLGLNHRAVKIQTSRTAKHQRSFVARASKIWNNLPDSLVQLADPTKFRSAVHRLLRK